MSHSVTDSTVLLGHGSGGQMMKRIIDEVFLDAFGSPELLAGNDAGVAALPASGRIAMSTDSFVVTPQFFPGGNGLGEGHVVKGHAHDFFSHSFASPLGRPFSRKGRSLHIIRVILPRIPPFVHQALEKAPLGC